MGPRRDPSTMSCAIRGASSADIDDGRRYVLDDARADGGSVRVRPELRVRSGLAARVLSGQGDGVQRSGGTGLEAEEPALDGGG